MLLPASCLAVHQKWSGTLTLFFDWGISHQKSLLPLSGLLLSAEKPGNDSSSTSTPSLYPRIMLAFKSLYWEILHQCSTVSRYQLSALSVQP